MTSRVLSAAFALLFLLAPAAQAQAADELPTEVSEALGLGVDEIAQAEPNPAWEGLGLFSEDSQRVLQAVTQERPFITYAFGDDPTGTPVFVPSGATPTGGGAMYWRIPESWVAPPAGWGTDMAFAQTAGSQLQPGDAVLVLWLEMDSDYDFASTEQVNEGFPLTVPGLPVWNSTFAGDTWEGANVIPNAIYDAGVLTLDVKRYEPPQSFPTVDLPAFYFRSGNLMAMAVSADGLLAIAQSATDVAAADQGETRTLLYTGDDTDRFAQGSASALDDLLYEIEIGGWSHITRDGQFTPGYIFYLIERYGAIETSDALDALGLWFIPAAEMLADDTAEALDEAIEEEIDDTIIEELLEDDEADDGSGDAATPPDDSGEATDTGGGSAGLLVGGGIAVAIATAIAIFVAKARREPAGDCADEKARWDADEELYRQSIDDVAKAQQTLADATEARAEAGRAYTKAKAEVPPDGTDSITDEDTGETITSLDRWLRDRHASAEWNRYQNDPNPETAKAYEEAMQEADTPEARAARQRDGAKAAQAAEQARHAFESAQQAEKAATSALERRRRDVDSAREMADRAKKAYEDCIEEQAEFDRASAEAKKRYDEAMERERERSEDRTDGGDETAGGGGGGTSIATPPEVELGGECWPPGAREKRPNRAPFTGDIMADNDTVTITFTRTHGTWATAELRAKDEDPFMSRFGDAVSGSGDRLATYRIPAKQASKIRVGDLAQAWQNRDAWVADAWTVTTTSGVTMEVSWDHRYVEATCSDPFICSAAATWERDGPRVFDIPVSRPGSTRRSFTFGAGDPSPELAKTWATLNEHVVQAQAFYRYQEHCHGG